MTSGKPVWFQPVNASDSQQPWYMDTSTTSGDCADAPQMDYPCDIAMWNQGLFDRWNSARDPGMGMSYFEVRLPAIHPHHPAARFTLLLRFGRLFYYLRPIFPVNVYSNQPQQVLSHCSTSFLTSLEVAPLHGE
jgi:hypothetical protein